MAIWLIVSNLNLVQSGGLAGAFASMPFVGTAPIVESGSNANGNWIKFADGTMICSKLKYLASLAVTNGTAPLYTSAQVDIGLWAMPFVDTPISTESVSNSNGSTCWIGVQFLQTLTNGKKVVVIVPASVTIQNVRIDAVAIGRWK